MSIRAIAWAFNQKVGSPVAKLVLIKMADNSDDEGRCWPSKYYLAAHTELSERSIQRAIKLLTERGFLRVAHRHGPDGLSLSNEYELAVETECPRRVSESPKVGRQSVSLGSQRVQSGGDRVSPKSYILEPSEEEDNNLTFLPAVKKSGPPAFRLPDWVPEKEWEEFAQHRKRKKAPLTNSISGRIILTLDKLRELGHSPAEVLTEAIDRNWTGLKVDWIHKPEPDGGSTRYKGFG